jgi:hypothetical protein
MCREHNAYLAELEYGKERMEQYRRRPDRVCEGSLEYAVGVPSVTFPPHEAAETCHV